MLLSLIESLAILAYVGLVIFAVVRGCRFADAHELRIASPHPVADAVARLAAACASPGLIRGSQAMVGHVLPGSVRLRRVTGQRNSFRPVFNGDFREEGGEVVLVGEFGMAASVQLFLMVWCGGLVASLGRCLFGAVVQGQSSALPVIAMGALMLVALVTLVHSAKKSSAGDVAWLAGRMREALA